MQTIRNAQYKLLGVGFLALAKGKNLLKGYDRARPFSTVEARRCADYDAKVVDEWLEILGSYAGPAAVRMKGKNVLELGSGDDLGVALYLLAKGAASYTAVDAFPLALQAPAEIYEAIFERLACEGSTRPIEELRLALRSAMVEDDTSRAIRYSVRSDFDVSRAVGRGTIDLVFSQAAFEHFDDIDATIRQVTRVCRPGAVLVAGIDLKTHSRWLRDKDPLNIYRHGGGVYRMLGFRGMPNRVTTSEYARILEKHGWKDIEMRVLDAVDDAYFEEVRPGLAPEFQRDETRNLWVMACATRGP